MLQTIIADDSKMPLNQRGFGLITGAQIRAACSLLGWKYADLANKCGVSYPTIQRATLVDGVPRIQSPNLFAIQAALEKAGIEFIERGVRVR
jgi:hypothetical protein